MTISLCMIVKNEEAVIGRCLDAVQDIADEIILVDTGSIDRTVDIAKKYTNSIYHYPWRDDFAAARNFAFSKARMDYQMWLDADDVIEAEDPGKISRIQAAHAGCGYHYDALSHRLRPKRPTGVYLLPGTADAPQLRIPLGRRRS